MDVLLEKYNVKIISPFDNLQVISGNGFKVNFKRTIFRLFKILKINSVSNRLIRSGKNLFGETELCSIAYIQPPAENKYPFILDVLIERFLGILDVLSRFGRDNRRLIIYNSAFTMNKFRVVKKDSVERVLLPGILKNIPKVYYNDKQDQIVVTISRISREKNLEALGNILRGIECKHFIIGYCSDFKYLNYLKLLLPNSKIIPNGTEEEKNLLLKQAKILIHPSINEPAGMVYMEAMSYGVIPIAHDSGGTREIVPEKYRYENPREACLKIKQYLDTYDENVMSSLQELSREFTEENFRKNLLSIMEEYFTLRKS